MTNAPALLIMCAPRHTLRVVVVDVSIVFSTARSSRLPSRRVCTVDHTPRALSDRRFPLLDIPLYYSPMGANLMCVCTRLSTVIVCD